MNGIQLLSENFRNLMLAAEILFVHNQAAACILILHCIAILTDARVAHRAPSVVYLLAHSIISYRRILC